MKNKIIFFLIVNLILTSCVGVSSSGIFGTGVSVALDPRSVGTQIDDSIMQKEFNQQSNFIIGIKNIYFTVKSKVLDGRIFLTGKVDGPKKSYY